MGASRGLFRVLVLGLAAALPGGCAGVHHDVEAFVRRPMPMTTSSDYRVEPPDVLMITSSRVPELQEMSQQIHPDGKLHLPLLGTFDVSDKTLQKIREELTVAARRYYKGADVSVRVVGFRSKKIYVFGHVRRPGPLNYDGTNTILQSLAESQPTDLADLERIRVIRPSLTEDQAPARMTVNLKRMAHEGFLHRESVLEEGDIIWVPPTALAKVGLALQQLLLPLQPAAATVSAPATIATGADATTGGGN